MKRSLVLYQVGGLTFTAVLGTILHFLYEWTGLVFLSPISAVNESTWEHMKLFFFPAFIYAIISGIFLIGEYPEFWCVKLIGILVGLLTIPVLFYTYNGAIGKSPDWLNILIFFISAFLSYFIEWLVFKNRLLTCRLQILAIILIVLISALFMVFTFIPPSLPIFQPPNMIW